MTGAPISGIRDCHPRHSTDYNTLATYDVHSKQGAPTFRWWKGAPLSMETLGNITLQLFYESFFFCVTELSVGR